MKQTSGIPTFDTFLEGGLELGDNILWVSANRGDLDPVVSEFLEVRSGTSSATGSLAAEPSGSLRRIIRFSEVVGTDLETGPDTQLVNHVIDADTPSEQAAVEASIVADDVGEGDRIVVSDVDDLVSRFGAEATIELYQRTCPRLFERGAVAYWMASRELVGAMVVDGVSRVAQCVFEVRDDRLRVLKAEGRSSWLHGAMVDLDLSGDRPMVSREHAVGRLGEGLRRVRSERGLTQAQMAELARVTPAAVSQAETGRRGLSLDTLVPLVEALGLGLDELLGTGRPKGPFIARPDRRPASTGSALFDDPEAGPRVHLVQLGGGESRRVPIATRGTELVLCIAGLVMVDLGRTAPVLRAHDALMVTEESVQSFKNLGDGPASLYWVAP